MWWYEPPDEKARPYLVISRDSVLPALERPLAVPATGHRRGIPTEVELDETDGMPRSCVLSLDNTRTIQRSFCTRRITLLGPERLAQVCAALRVATDC